jgi:RND family efflux transporter MFP subunit
MEKTVFEGEAFRSGENLYMIADLSGVWVNAEVFESDAALVREGMPAEVSIAALTGRSLEGRIEYVYPTVEDRTRSMRARISIPNPRGELKPGMYATVTLRPEVGEVLTVPSSAILYSGERAIAFVDMGGGSIMPREVRVGVRGAELVQVLEGVEPGQRVVTSALFLLDSESNLAEVMKAMMVEMGMSGMDMEGMDMDPDADSLMNMRGGSDKDMGEMDMSGGSEE